MTTLYELYPDLINAQADPTTLRVIQDLDAVCGGTAAPAALRAALADTLQAQATARQPSGVPLVHLPARPWRRIAAAWYRLPAGSYAAGSPRTISIGRQMRARLVALVATVALATGGIGSYVVLHGTTPVSAQTIMQRAARAYPALTPDQVLHQTSQLYFGARTNFGLDSHTVVASGPITINVDQWTRFDATGAMAQQTTTGTSSTGGLLFRILQTGNQAQIYDAPTNVLENTAAPTGKSLYWVERLLGDLDLRQLVRAAAQGQIPHLRLLPSQTLNGLPVDVVEMSSHPPTGGRLIFRGGASVTTLYIDAKTYAIRGFDRLMQWAQGNWERSMSIRITGSTALPLSAAPAGTFTLQAPPDAHVVGAPFQPLGLAQAIAQVDGPTPLLPGAPDGLSLRSVSQIDDPEFTGVSYGYGPPIPALGDLDPAYRGFSVEIQTALARLVVQMDTTVEQPLTLTIAGQQVAATYYEYVSATPHAPLGLVYRQGTNTVQLIGIGLAKAEFFHVVTALVDGRTNPTVVTQLQRELDASNAAAPGDALQYR